MTRFLTTGIRAPDLGSPVLETTQSAAMKSESEWEKNMKRIKQNLKEIKKLVRKRYPRRRRLPVWEDDEAWWWRRRKRSSMEDWAPNVHALFESKPIEEEEEDEDAQEEEEEDEQGEVEEEEDENEEEGMDLSKSEEEYHTKVEMGMMTEEESPAATKREVTFAGKDTAITEPVGEAMVVTLDLKEMAETREGVWCSPTHQQWREEKLATAGEIWIPGNSVKLSSSEPLEPPEPIAPPLRPPKPPDPMTAATVAREALPERESSCMLTRLLPPKRPDPWAALTVAAAF